MFSIIHSRRPDYETTVSCALCESRGAYDVYVTSGHLGILCTICEWIVMLNFIILIKYRMRCSLNG